MEITVPFLLRYLYRNPKLLLLGIVSGLSTSLWVFRVIVTHDGNYSFMVWNLFLALLPLLVAKVLSEMNRTDRLPLLLAGLAVWLLLVPNSFYMITDLMHIKHANPATIWYDSLMFFSFAMTGLLAGVYSWYIIHKLVAGRYGDMLAWLGVLSSSGLIAFGIYLGRYGRWNSWDILTNPMALGWAIWDSAHNPVARQLTVAFAFTLLLVYVAFHTYYELRKYEVNGIILNDRLIE